MKKYFSDAKLEVLRNDCEILNIATGGLLTSVEIAKLISGDEYLIKRINSCIDSLNTIKKHIKAEF